MLSRARPHHLLLLSRLLLAKALHKGSWFLKESICKGNYEGPDCTATPQPAGSNPEPATEQPKPQCFHLQNGAAHQHLLPVKSWPGPSSPMTYSQASSDTHGLVLGFLRC